MMGKIIEVDKKGIVYLQVIRESGHRLLGNKKQERYPMEIEVHSKADLDTAYQNLGLEVEFTTIRGQLSFSG